MCAVDTPALSRKIVASLRALSLVGCPLVFFGNTPSTDGSLALVGVLYAFRVVTIRLMRFFELLTDVERLFLAVRWLYRHFSLKHCGRSLIAA